MEERACRRLPYRCRFRSGAAGHTRRSQSCLTDQLPHELVALTTSQNLLATDPNAIARFLETARPAPVSSEDKARVLSTLPLEGEVIDLSASARLKIAALTRLLRATERESVYEIKVIDVPQAAIGLHARAVILISEPALDPARCGRDSRPWWRTKSGTSTSGRNVRTFLQGCGDRSRLKDPGAHVRWHRHRDAARAWNGSCPG